MQYWVLPSIIGLVFLGFYFSGIQVLQDFVAPPANREFGALELTQLLLLLIAGYFAVKGIRNFSSIPRLFFMLSSFFLLFLFLEEMDYGMHYWNLIQGNLNAERDYNIHNQGYLQTFKAVCYYSIALVFVILPFLKGKIRHATLRYLIPEKNFITTVAVIVIISRSAHLLKNLVDHNQALLHNFAEYEEVLIYYLYMLYFGKKSIRY